jgi:hypothetical protein
MVAMYIYAIIPTGKRMLFDVAGMDDDHDEVYSIPYHDLAAVVSASPLADYRGLKRDEAVRYLVVHQQVVEAVLRDFPVLPVRFGTVLPDETWVHHLLKQGESLFRTTLERFDGQVQMEAVVLWNLAEVFQEIGREDDIAQLTARMANLSPEKTVTERVAIGQMVKASLERRRAELVDCLLPPLQEVALDQAINPAMDDSMVANVALLVDEAGRGQLDQRLEMLDKRFEGRLHFRCVGPLPPYSFASVEVQLPTYEVVDEARRRLGLGETATQGEIRRAYRQLVARLHPDHNPQDPEAEARMTAMTQAYQLLTAYAQSQALERERPMTNDERPTINDQRSSFVIRRSPACNFSREAVDRTLLIAIRRQEVKGP